MIMTEVMTSAKFFDKLYDPIVIVDTMGIILYGNKAFLKFSQISQPSLGKDSLYRVLKLNIPGGEPHPLTQCLQAKKYVGLREITGQHLDDTRFSILMGIQPLLSEDGQTVQGLLVNLQDKSMEVALNLKYQETIEKMEQEFNESVRVFSSITEMVEVGAQGFGGRVATLSRRMAEQMGMDEKEARKVEIAGHLHHIGTLGMHPATLEKRFADLSDLEKKDFEKYPVLGSLIFDGIEAFKEICQYIHEHREHYDGKGFPRGLAKDRISLGAAIVHLAVDVTQWCDQDENLESEELLKRVNQHKGMVYHPKVVEALSEVMSTQHQFTQRMERRTIDLSDLKPGMTLAKDMRSGKGILLLQEDEKVTTLSLKRLHRFHENDPMTDKVEIYAPVEKQLKLGNVTTTQANKIYRILVVDDTVDLNMLLCMMINKAEDMVSEGVYSGPEALQILAEKSFDAIVLDVMMPIMSGLQTLEAIRKRYPDLPVVMCTAKSEQQDVLEAFRLGADDYLVKPIKKEPLQQTLLAILHKYYHQSFDYKILRKEQMAQVLKKIAPELLLKKEEQATQLSVRFRRLKGGEPNGDTLKCEASDLSKLGFTLKSAPAMALGSRLTFALEDTMEKRLLLAGIGVVSKVTLERGRENYKVDFISVRKPN